MILRNSSSSYVIKRLDGLSQEIKIMPMLLVGHVFHGS